MYHRSVPFICNIKHEKPCLTTFPSTEKRVENRTRNGVFFDKLRGVSTEMWSNIILICPSDSVIHPLNNWVLMDGNYLAFQQSSLGTILTLLTNCNL